MNTLLNNVNTTADNMTTPLNLGVTLQANDTNTFRPYDSALPVPVLKGYRNVKLLYKAHPKTKVKVADNSYIRVNDHITKQLIQDNIQALAPYIVGYLQAEEDKLIKSYHIAGASTVQEADLNLSKIVDALEASTVSQRLNKEKIEDWFKAELQDALMIALANKTGISLEEPTEEEIMKLDTVLTAYRNKYSSMAGGKTYYKKEEAQMLLQALCTSESASQSFIGVKLKSRLDSMMNDTPDTLLMSL